MVQIQNLIDNIKKHEGLSLEVYNCTEGCPTIGYGHKLLKHEIKLFRKISLDTAERLLQEDIGLAIQGAMGQFPNKTWREMPNECRLLMCEMAYQMGARGLGKFSNMIRAIKERRYDVAAREMRNSLWAVQTPKRAEEMAKRMDSIAV